MFLRPSRQVFHPRINTPSIKLLSRSVRPFMSCCTPAKRHNNPDKYDGAKNALHRNDHLDPQSDSAHSGLRARQEKSEQEKQSQAISQKDEGRYNEKAKEQHPKAPWPVIGMNDERGGRGR